MNEITMVNDGSGHVVISDGSFCLELPTEWAATLDRLTILSMFWKAKREAREREERAKLSWWQQLVKAVFR